MSNQNGVHHVVNSLPVRGESAQAYCGRFVNHFDMPIEIDHARACIEQGKYLQPCKNCMRIKNKLDKASKED